MDFNLALRGGHASNASVHPAPTETTKARQPKGLPQRSSNRSSTLRGGHASNASVHPAPTETTKARQPEGLPQRSNQN